jgi:glutamate synthase (NADPH/NADH) small chain
MTTIDPTPIVDRKARMKIPFEEPPERPVAERLMDFRETRLPLTPERAVREASRCLQCPMAPCVKACPAHNDIPRALRKIEQGDFLAAAGVYRQTSSMSQICGRVCPHEQLCQCACVRTKTHEPVLCGALESFAADAARAQNSFQIQPGVSTGKRVAVVGSGPAGLACAEQLAIQGHRVVIFESHAAPGGMLFYGIPSFKVENSIVETMVADLRHAGVEFRLNTRIGKDYPIERLRADGFDAVFLGTGSPVPYTLNIPGNELRGIFPPDEFLARLNVKPEFLPAAWQGKFPIGERVVVIGGGDTASDCLRSALRMGAGRVKCLYRRTEAEMPGGKKDRELAKEEGADYHFLAQPVRFLGDAEGRVCAVECLECELGEADAEGRRRPIAIEGSNFTVDADTVVLALGYGPDPDIARTAKGLEIKQNGLVQADGQNGATSRPEIFAGGDAVTGPDIVCTAMVAGRNAAQSIGLYLQKPQD